MFPDRLLEHDPEKACPGRDPGWVPVSRLREALARLVIWLDASAGEGRSEKIMLQAISDGGMTIRRKVIPPRAIR
jgi:hypothetical protein